MEKTYLGSCLCEKVKFKIEGGFESFYLCHCKYCQKDTGSAHAANLFSNTGRIAWIAGEEKVKIFTLPATRHTKSFCEDCGAALPSLQMEGKLLAVPAGCLDSELDLKPDAHIFHSSRANWDDKLETIRKFGKLQE